MQQKNLTPTLMMMTENSTNQPENLLLSKYNNNSLSITAQRTREKQNLRRISPASLHGLSVAQQLFISFWLNPNSETFSDIEKSAVKAGLDPAKVTRQIKNQAAWVYTAQQTFLDDLCVDAAKQNMYDFLTTPITGVETALKKTALKIKADFTKFVLERKGGFHSSTAHEINLTKTVNVNIANVLNQIEGKVSDADKASIEQPTQIEEADFEEVAKEEDE